MSASTATPSCITSFAYRLRAFVSVRPTRQGPSGRHRRGSLERLRVTGLLNLEHRESSHFVLGQWLGIWTDHLEPSLLHRFQLRIVVYRYWDSITSARRYPCVVRACDIAFALFKYGSKFCGATAVADSGGVENCILPI